MKIHIYLIAIIVLVGLSGCSIQKDPIVVPDNKVQKQTVEKIVLDNKTIEELSTGPDVEYICGIDLNKDAPNETVQYTDNENGFSVNIPYNPEWGNETYDVPPYGTTDDKKVFSYGEMYTGGEGCYFDRKYSFRIVPARSVSSVIAQYEENNDIADTPTTSPKLLNINGLQVVEYVEPPEMPSGIEYQIIGKKYNYVLYGNWITSVEYGYPNNPFFKIPLESFRLLE